MPYINRGHDPEISTVTFNNFYNNMQDILSIYNNLSLSKENKLRVDLGLENPSGIPTTLGVQLLTQIIWKKYSAEIDEAATKIKSEIDEKSKK